MGTIAIVALSLWSVFVAEDLAAYGAYVPDLPWPLLVLGLVLFSVVNALLEELVFRGLVQGALADMLGPGLVPVLIQAALFGVCHWQGFPSGPIGALMAGFWAFLLGLARRRTEGLLTPFLAHIAADAAIFTIVGAQLELES